MRLHEWVGEQVVLLCGRYIWRGKLLEVGDPMLELEAAHQVTDHGAEGERESIYVGRASVSLLAVEAAYPAADALWVPK